MWDRLCLITATMHDRLLFHWTDGQEHSVMQVSGRATRLEVNGNTFVSISRPISVQDCRDNLIFLRTWMVFSVERIFRSIYVTSSGKHLLLCS